MFLGSPEEDTVAVKSSEFLEEPGENLKDKLVGKKKTFFSSSSSCEVCNGV